MDARTIPIAQAQQPQTSLVDQLVFGWDATPGIVSVWADRDGRALVWRRMAGQVLCERARYRPWLFAADLADLESGYTLLTTDQPHTCTAPIAVTRLVGDHDRCQFLLTARHGRTLEQAILAGATRRLGRTVSSLYELEDRYIRVGPVEQYLMASGRVYFRGLEYDNLLRMQIDFETTALEPTNGWIFMAALRDSTGWEQILEAAQPADEPALITSLCQIINQRDPDILENHNLFGFDLPFLEARAELYGLKLAIGRTPGPRLLARQYEAPSDDPEAPRKFRYTLAGRELIDTLDAVRRHDFVTRDLPSHRLKDVARHFGVATTTRTYISGALVYATYRDQPELVRNYALDDVREVDALSRRLLTADVALAGMAPRRYERLTNAGPAMGILEPMLLRAYLHHLAGPPKPGVAAGAPEAPHAGGALHLFATGVATRVVKADVASLYPSIMNTYGIGSHADPLGALLAIVRRLTELRLMHKQAARAGVAGSTEASRHQALQAAMKLLINSAYGYLGAGRMALFADRAAADQITRRGREVLDHVVGQLRQAGVALIEADTDGVYFAVPEGWHEADERALVAQVAGTLPAAIRLEYEGRYQAMFSHEVKNYALLTYDGQVIIRGGAMRSSRSEPYGERFLRQALEHLLRGEVRHVYRCFGETVTALRTRQLTAADVATRVRLTKTPAAYAKSRSSHREAAYEALLAAGQTEWARGQRIRFYRGSLGSSIWLADDSPEQDAARDYDVDYYLATLITSYAGRMRKAFRPEDFAVLFRVDGQLGLFDGPIDSIQPLWITT